MTKPEPLLTGMPYVPGIAHGILRHGLNDNPAGCIVLLDAPLPGPWQQLPTGFVVIDGAPLSHAMIPLLGSGVPTVIVTREQAEHLQVGRMVMLDGASGRITTAAGATGADLSAASPAAPAVAAAGRSADGTRVLLCVSARDVQSVRRAVIHGVDAIGLVRSEYLAPVDGHLPDATFYRAAFRALCEAAGELPVTIRLIDIAADKQPAWLPPEVGVGGALGLQGVRLYHDEPLRSIYLAQLEAIATLAAEFRLRVLLPYVADRDELQYWIDNLRLQLPAGIPLGAMAETPAAALQLGEWCGIADFVGLGCNDLMQCLFGADRDRPELRHYLNPHAPVLYRFLREVAATGRDQLGRVQLCGVLPQLPGILPVLLGLGFRVFSVEAAQLTWLGQAIANTRLCDAESLAERVCRARSPAEVSALLARGLPVPAGRDESVV
jgi:phosphoenolpyruvate-protein kinase (PTS system EI component)